MSAAHVIPSRPLAWQPFEWFFTAEVRLWNKKQSYVKTGFLANFCPRRTVFVGDYEVAVMCSLLSVCHLLSVVCLFKTFSYFWNQTSEFYETLLVLFIGQ